jgi:hypothetical protein
LAAERGLDAILVYLHKDLDLGVNELDCEGRTPLHLAAMHGNITTSAFLLAWKAEVNVQDGQGNTCLHLAAAIQSYKLIRLLLIKGADKRVRNESSQTAYQVAKVFQVEDVTELLVVCIQALWNWKTGLNPFIPDFRNTNNNPGKFIFYCGLFAIRSFLLIVCVVRTDYFYIYVTSLALICLSMTSFMISSCKDPGFVKKERTGILGLVERYRCEFICPFCECIKNHETRHCFVCNKCVDVGFI